MSNMEMATLSMLRAAAELYHDCEILRDAIEGDEHDLFSTEFICDEWEMLQDTVRVLSERVTELLGVFGDEVNRRA